MPTLAHSNPSRRPRIATLAGLALTSVLAFAGKGDRPLATGASSLAGRAPAAEPTLSLFAGPSGSSQGKGKAPFKHIRAIAHVDKLPAMDQLGDNGKGLEGGAWLVGDAEGLKVVTRDGDRLKAVLLKGSPRHVVAIAVRPAGSPLDEHDQVVFACHDAQRNSSRILSLRPGGEFLELTGDTQADAAGASSSTPQRRHVSDLSLTSDGRVIFMDPVRREVRALDPDGRELILARIPAEPGASAQDLADGTAAPALGPLACDQRSNDLFVVVGHSILQSTRDGQEKTVLKNVETLGLDSASPAKKPKGARLMRPTAIRFQGDHLFICDEPIGLVIALNLKASILTGLVGYSDQRMDGAEPHCPWPSGNAAQGRHAPADLHVLSTGICMIATEDRLFQFQWGDQQQPVKPMTVSTQAEDAQWMIKFGVTLETECGLTKVRQSLGKYKGWGKKFQDLEQPSGGLQALVLAGQDAQAQTRKGQLDYLQALPAQAEVFAGQVEAADTRAQALRSLFEAGDIQAMLLRKAELKALASTIQDLEDKLARGRKRAQDAFAALSKRCPPPQALALAPAQPGPETIPASAPPPAPAPLVTAATDLPAQAEPSLVERVERLLKKACRRGPVRTRLEALKAWPARFGQDGLPVPGWLEQALAGDAHARFQATDEAVQTAKTQFRNLPEAGLQALETRLQAVGLDLMALKALLADAQGTCSSLQPFRILPCP